MEAAHREGVDVVKLCRLLYPSVELAVYGITVGFVVPFAVNSRVPLQLRCVVEQQWLAMRCRYHDSEAVGCNLVFGIAIKRRGTGMHCRSEHVTLQSQYKLAYLRIGARADISHFGFNRLSGPRRKAPIFIVEEYASIANRGGF